MTATKKIQLRRSDYSIMSSCVGTLQAISPETEMELRFFLGRKVPTAEEFRAFAAEWMTDLPEELVNWFVSYFDTCDEKEITELYLHLSSADQRDFAFDLDDM